MEVPVGGAGCPQPHDENHLTRPYPHIPPPQAFLKKQDEEPIYATLLSIVFLLMTLVCLILWVSATYSLQNTLDKNFRELSTPIPAYSDLCFVDYVEAKKQVVRLERQKWSVVTTKYKAVLITGCVTLVASSFLFYYFDELCWQTFEVTTPIDEFSSDFVQPLGWLALALYVV